MPTVSCGFHDAPYAQGSRLLVDNGPEILVNIGFDPNWNQDQNAPPVAKINRIEALIDTGAVQSCIDMALAAKLKLTAFDRRTICGVNGTLEVDYYLAQIHIPSLKFTQRGTFAGVPLAASGFKQTVLLGRSFLSYVRMEYDGTSGSVFLSI